MFLRQKTEKCLLVTQCQGALRGYIRLSARARKHMLSYENMHNSSAVEDNVCIYSVDGL